MSNALVPAIEALTRAAERQVELLEEAASRGRQDEDRAWLDRAPRKEPRRFDFPLLVAAVPGLAEQFKKLVPGEFWHQVADNEATVACPCGHEPVCPLGIPSECECDRFFLWTRKEMRVARYPEESTVTVD